MKRLARFLMILAAAMVLVPYLPLFIERTMRRAWLMNGGGTLVEWGWERCTLDSYWANYVYFDREQRPALWLAVNLALGLTYALLIALSLDQILTRWMRRRERFR